MVTEYPFATGPYLEAAFFCEKILQEIDGTKSAIRIVDRVTQNKPGPVEMQPFEHDLTLFVRFKSGLARGTMTFKLTIIKPSGESPAPLMIPMLFEGEEDRGGDVVLSMRMKFDQTGIHWFIVSLNDTVMTKIPLRIIYMPQIMQVQLGG